jgi:hypothetical protein
VKRAKQGTTSRPPPSATRESGLVPLSCPDCSGVLRFEREGQHGHLLYRCQVDHRYTLSSLLDAKESKVEETLWSAVLLLTQMVYAYEDLMSEMKKATMTERKRVKRRISELRKQCLAIRAMIEATHVLE